MLRSIGRAGKTPKVCIHQCSVDSRCVVVGASALLQPRRPPYVLAMGGYGAVGAQPLRQAQDRLVAKLTPRKNGTSPDKSGSYGLYPFTFL